MHSIVPSDTQQTDTYFVVAHSTSALRGSCSRCRRFYTWWPKVFGKMLNEKMGKLNFWLMVIGSPHLLPDALPGFGPARRTYTYPSGMGWTR